MTTMKLRNSMRGAMVGGAIGDALGYPVRSIKSFEGIQAKYGVRGITRMDTTRWWLDNEELDSEALVTDKTQMTIYTAWGLLNAATPEMAVASVREACIEWYLSQIGWANTQFEQSWLRKVEGLNERREADYTSMMALRAAFEGELFFSRSNGSAGMARIAPAALYAASSETDIEAADLQAAEIAKITHLHPLGYIPAALEAHLLYRLAADEAPSHDSFIRYIQEGMSTVRNLFAGENEALDRLQELVEKAIALTATCLSDVKAIESIGEGKMAEEALAIAIYCSLKHFGNFEAAVVAAVNHMGASDTTGALTGSLMGAALGYNAIPARLKDNVELQDLLLSMADDLWNGSMLQQEMHEKADTTSAEERHLLAC